MPSPVLNYTTCTIADGASLSDAIDLNGANLCVIQLPSGWDTAGITFQGSVDGGTTFVNVYDATATEYAVSSISASKSVKVAPTFLDGYTHIKIRSGTAGSPVNQSGAVTLTVGLVRYVK